MSLATQPTVLVQIGFASDPLTALASQTWTDVSQYVLGFTTNIGRQHELGTVQAGTVDIRLANQDGRFDPTNTSSPYSPNVLPAKRIRIRATWNAVTYDVFNGFIEHWGEEWPDVTDAYVTVHAVDAFKMLNLKNLVNPYLKEVLADSPTVWYRLNDASSPNQTIADASGQGRTGAATGSPLYGQPGPVAGGAAMTFDSSTSDAVVTPNLPPIGTSDFSLECWVQVHKIGADLIRADVVDGANTNKIVSAVSNAYFQTRTSGGTTYEVDSTATYSDGKWHHIVGTRSTTTMLVYADGAQVGTLTTGTTANLLALVYRIGLPSFTVGQNYSLAEAAIYPVALSATRVTAHYTAASSWANDLTGTRVNRILDAIGWASADRNVEAGMSLMPAAPQPGNALQALTDAALAEGGLLFQAPNGQVTFYQRSHLITAAASNTAQATFGDAGGAELPYILQGIQPKMDDLDLWNDVQASASSGVLQEAQDTASQTKYGTRTLSLSQMKLASDNDALSRAQHDLSFYKDPRLRVRQFTITPSRTDPTNLFPHALGRSLWDRVEFRRIPPGGGSRFIQQSIIEGISHSYSKADWTTTYALSPAEDVSNYLILDDATKGKLNTAALGW